MLGTVSEDSESKTVIALAAASVLEATLTPNTLTFKMQTGENLMQYRPTMSCVVRCIARDCSGVILVNLFYFMLNCKYSSVDYTSTVPSTA